MKHKHYDLIVAWAAGAKIEMSFMGDWIDMGEKFMWVNDSTYRIKPEENKPVVRWLWAYKDSGSKRWRTTDLFGEKEAAAHWVKLEWSRTEFPE